MKSRKLTRGALALAALLCLFTGAIAAFAPRTFYDDFPFVGHYVALSPPYNEHLVTDVGGLYLGFALVFAIAARRPQRTLVLAVSCGFILSAVLHLVFHASHLGGISTADAVGELTGLALLLAPPAVAIWSVSARRAV